MKRVALVGVGMVAQTHLAALCDGRNLHLACVMGRDRSKADTFAKSAEETLHTAPGVADSIQQIVARPDIDFVILATPPDARQTYVELLAAAGKPILMEKPIERTYASARHIVEVCHQADVTLGVIFQHRARDVSVKLKSMVDAGDLGDIQTLEIRVPWWRDQSYYDVPGRGTYARDGGGVMINQAIHTLDLALWIFGPMAWVQAYMHRTDLHELEAEDWASVIFALQNGAVGTLMATTAAYPGTAESIAIQGTKAHAHLQSGVLKVDHVDGRRDIHGVSAQTGGGADPMAFTHAWHQTIFEDFADCLDEGRPPIASGKSALHAHAAIEAMTLSHKTGQRQEVTIP